MLLFCTVLLYWVEQCRTRWRELVTYTTSFAAVVSMAIVYTVRFVFTTVCESLCRWWFCGLQHLMDAFKRHRFILMPGTANAALWKIRFFHRGGGGGRVRGEATVWWKRVRGSSRRQDDFEKGESPMHAPSVERWKAVAVERQSMKRLIFPSYNG